MRFKDEKPMWWDDTRELAKKLANKNEREVMSILDECDVIKLRSGNRPKATAANRIILVVAFIPLIIVSGIKWMCTGDVYLDSWAKKSKTLNCVLRSAFGDI